MYVGKERILDWIERSDGRFWWLYSKNKEDVIERNETTKDDENSPQWTVENSVNKLSSVLDAIEDGVYWLECRTAISDIKHTNKTFIKLMPKPADTPAVIAGIQEPTVAANNISAEELQRREKEAYERGLAEAKAEFDRQQMQAKIGDLQKEVKELRSSRYGWMDGLGQIVNAVLPYIGQFLGNGQAAIGAQPEQTNNNEGMNEQQQRLNAVIANFQRIEPEKWLDLLEAIVRLAKEDQSKYNMAKAVLMAQN